MSIKNMTELGQCHDKVCSGREEILFVGSVFIDIKNAFPFCVIDVGAMENK
jgi:hypothetical protein